jgi:ribosome-binding protein aMBF1 (putative translation factor)
VTLATILRICDAFGVTPFALLPRARETKPKLGPPRVLRFAAISIAEPVESGPRHPGQLMENPIQPAQVEAADLQKRVGKAIQRFRLAGGFTQDKLAKSLECSVKYLQAVEGGKQNLSLESLAKFSRTLGVAVHHLLEPEG